MNQREALRGAAEHLLGPLQKLAEDAMYLESLKPADRVRMANAYDILRERLEVMAYGRQARKPQVAPPDPNQIHLFE